MRQAKGTIVVGAGIVGLCCALALQRRGQSVMLIDPARKPPPASYGNAGHIAIEQAEPLASLATIRSAPGRLTLFGGSLSLPPAQIGRWLPFALRLARAARPDRFAAGKAALSGLLAQAMPAWHRLAGSLEPPGLLLQHGHAVVWHGKAAAAEGLAAWRDADIGTARFHEASPDELAWLSQAMRTPPSGAILFENTGQIADPLIVLGALREAFRQAGGEQRRGLVRALIREGGQAALVLDSGEHLLPENLVLAGGVESGALLAPFGVKVPLIAERGYHIQSADHAWPDGLPPVVFEQRSMIVTRFRSALRMAGFVEFGRHDAPPDERKWRRLDSNAASLGLPAKGPWQRWVGSRPTLPDYMPAIGRDVEAGNLFYAFGHQHLGLTLAPVTGEIIAALVLAEETPVPVLPFDYRRFG